MGFIDCLLMASFLLTADFWPNILATADFCDVGFNDSAQPIQTKLIFLLK